MESPGYFGGASETGRDVGEQYIQSKVGTLPAHKFLKYTKGSQEYEDLPQTVGESNFQFLLEVFVDDFVGLAIPESKDELDHCANGIQMGIHDVFPEATVDEEDPISLKKAKQGDAQWSSRKDALGFDFDGRPGKHTLVLAKKNRDELLKELKRWLRLTKKKKGIPGKEFRSGTAKMRNAFIAIPAGKGLFTPLNRLLAKEPPFVHLYKPKNLKLFYAIKDGRTLLREATRHPTRCRELVGGWPDYIGVKDASLHGVGGIIVGENMECTPTVFRVPWPEKTKQDLVSTKNPKGRITNSDLEMAGLLLLFLVMEAICPKLLETYSALFNDNSPTVGWAKRMAAKGSLVAGQLLRALALRLKARRTSPLTPQHISGTKNRMTDIPSRSFGSEKKALQN